MMAKKFLFAAWTLLLLASCASDDFTGDSALGEANRNAPISFGFDIPATTRASGAEAATALNHQFIVYGEKGEANGNLFTADDATTNTHQLVFRNYAVQYSTNTAYSTTSNTKDWEYVGVTPTYGTYVTPQAEEVQTIKFWDYAAPNYVFTAFSALPADLTAGKVTVTKTQSGATVYDKGYTATVTDAAALGSLYFADRVPIAQTGAADRTAANQYGGHVDFTFRNALSRVRVAMYETIPGYDVQVKKFYYQDAAAPAFADMTTASASAFVANVPNVPSGVAGTFTVTYYPQSIANDAAGITNRPCVTFAPTTPSDAKNYLTLGTGITAATSLGVSSDAPTYDQAADAFTPVMPQESNTTPLKLKLDYQLKNTATGETIDIEGKTAEVPAPYLQWKPNCQYTYLFKITDDELCPISFDAILVDTGDGVAEYITIVSEPSITTFGVKDGTYEYGEADYSAGSDIYATVMDGGSVAAISLGTKVNVYRVTSSTVTITEATVASALGVSPEGSRQMTCTRINDAVSPYFTDAPAVVASVPTEDGSTVAVNALKLTGVAASGNQAAYVIEYVKTPTIYANDGGQTYTYEAYYQETTENFNTLYTDEACMTLATGWDSETTYYKRNGVATAGKYVYKVIIVTN